jgi:putative nucleotidyltransferase with HDIG domain
VPTAAIRYLERANKELWLILSMFAIALLLNHLFDSQRMMLSFYVLPTLGSAYLYGRRHATLTALASVLIVTLMMTNSSWLAAGKENALADPGAWIDLGSWGGTLIITGYLMGTLYERQNTQLRQMRETYNGVLMLLRHFISKDEYTEHHSYRVSLYATRIAAHMGLSADRIEDVRAASLLHDIGKLEISRELLYKAAQFTGGEFREVQRHVDKGVAMLETVGGSLRRVIPIVLAHHDKFNGSGYHPTEGCLLYTF